MKKVLALVLCAPMLIGGMGIVSFAEETTDRIAITNGSTLDGWSINAKEGDGIPALHINTEIDPDGYGAVAMTLTGEIYANGGWSHPEGNGKTPTKGMKIVYKPADDKSKGVESYDVSGMNYFAFDLYLSDASVLEGKKMYLELTSSGTVDQQEICWEMTLDRMNGGKALVDGWNHVEVALNSYNQTPSNQKAVFDNTQWNFMRLHNGDAFDAGESFTIALKNLYFSVLSSDGKLPGEQPTTPVAPVDPVTPPADDWAPIPVEGGFVFPNDKWLDSRSEGLPQGEWADDLAEADGVKPWSVTYTGLISKEGGWNRPEGATGWKVCFTLPNTADISGMKFMVLDFYISDASAIENALFYLELSSRPGGNVDMEENNIRASLSQIAGKPIVDGWNHLEISLDAMTQGTGNDKPIAMDPTRFKTMRIYSTQNDIDLGDKELVVAYKNFGFIESSKAADIAKEAAESVIALFEQIADIGTGDITADNYETVKAQLAAALEAYEAADVGTQAAVEEAGINANKIKRTIERALDKYEEELNQPTDEPTDEPTKPADPEKPDTPSKPDTPEKPDTPADPTDPEQPADEGGLNPVVIVVVAVAVVAVAAVVVIVLAKKKK